MQQPDADRSRRPLGTPSLTALVVASMIGSGVYTTSGFVLADFAALPSRGWVLLAWLLAGAIALCGAVSYGRLAKRLAENGGEYLYLSRAVHPAAGFLAGWVSLWAGFTGAGSLAVVTFESYLRSVAPLAAAPQGTLAIALAAAVTGLHLLGVRRGAIGQMAAVGLKLALVGVFLAVAFTRFDQWDAAEQTQPVEQTAAFPLMAFATSLVWISFSYTGFNAAIYVAGEAADGSRSVARAMTWGTAAVTGLYLLLNAVFVFAPPRASVAGQANVATIAAEVIAGPAFAQFVTGLICLGLATTASSIVMTGPRVYARMADDGLFPRWFATSDPGRPPSRAIALQGVLIAVVAVASDLQTLLSYLGLTLAVSSAATVATLFGRFSAADPEASPPTRRTSLAVPAVYVAATLAAAALATLNRPADLLGLVATLATGLAAYFALRHGVLRRRRSV